MGQIIKNARVKSIDAPNNRLTVELQDGTQRTYDPRRQQRVSVFREEMRSFSVGAASSSPHRPTTSELRTASWGPSRASTVCWRQASSSKARILRAEAGLLIRTREETVDLCPVNQVGL